MSSTTTAAQKTAAAAVMAAGDDGSEMPTPQISAASMVGNQASQQAAASSATRTTSLRTPKSGTAQRIDQVQVDGLVLMKIIKHARESPQEPATGMLLGMVHKNVMEITNTFPFPSADSMSGKELDEMRKEVISRMSYVNIDHMEVGWYKCSYLGSLLTFDVIDKQFSMQTKTAESVVLLYDPIRTEQGALSLRAFRLTPVFLGMYKNGTSAFTPDTVQEKRLNFEKVLEEIPLVLKTALLSTALVAKLQEEPSVAERSAFAEPTAAASAYVKQNVHMLMAQVDSLGRETENYHKYMRDLNRQRQQRDAFLTRRRMENAKLKEDGKPELPEDDPGKYKTVTAPSRLGSLLITGQIDKYCSQISQFATQEYSKLYLTKALLEREEN